MSLSHRQSFHHNHVTSPSLRLRRSHAKPSAATIVVRNVATNTNDGEPVSIPIGNGFNFVQDTMQAVIDAELKNKDVGVVLNKIIVLEIHHPQVPSIDLIDLPGLTTYPEVKAEEIRRILERQVQDDARTGNHAMYLAVVPASGDVRPNTNTAMAFIEKNGLKHRTFGVFSKCDQVTDSDILQTLILGQPTSDGDTAEEMGAVKLEKGWIASMLKKPADGTGPSAEPGGKQHKKAAPLAYYERADDDKPEGYYDAHNLERLYLQKRSEEEFFAHADADPALRELHANGHAGGDDPCNLSTPLFSWQYPHQVTSLTN